MREPANPASPTAYHASASAVAAVSAGPNRPRSKSRRTIGARSATSPIVAGTDTYTPSRSAKFSVPASPPRSWAAACRAITGSEAEASAMPKTPRGNSMTRSA